MTPAGYSRTGACNVAILPGIFSGKRTTGRLRRELQRRGFVITGQPAHADILLAHSAGCLWVPIRLKQCQTAILVNPPYWPGKTIRQRIRARSHSNFLFYKRGIPFHHWLVRNLWGWWYGCTQSRRTRYILHAIGRYSLEQAAQAGRFILVRNELDDWLTPDLQQLEQANPRLRVIYLPGDHDDFNYHPERYADLVQSVHA